MHWKRRIYYTLSPGMRRLFRRLYYLPADLWDVMSGKKNPMIPPRGKIYTGPGDYLKLGEKLHNDMVVYGGLKPNHHVLDIGCGIGRLAVPLTRFLDKNGSYHGFDVVKDGIDWCKKHISSRFSNFTFLYVPLQNDLYNLSTEKKASEFVFPFGDKAFDFVMLTSVFTHMQENDVRHYLNEISRILKQGGTCFATFFIIDDSSMVFLKQSSDPFFTHERETHMLHDDKVLDANIAYKLQFIKQWVLESGMAIEKHLPGWWAGRDKTSCVDFQDVLILRKM